jgi:hypothetical protein
VSTRDQEKFENIAREHRRKADEARRRGNENEARQYDRAARDAMRSGESRSFKYRGRRS